MFGFHQCTQSPACKTCFVLSKRDSLYCYVSRSHTGVRLLWEILLLHFAPLRGAVDAILQSSHLRGKLRARNPSTVSPFSFSVRIELSNLCTAFPAQIMLAAQMLLASSAFCKAPRRISPLKVKIFCVTHAYRGSTDGLIVAQRHVVHGGIFRTAPYGHDFAPFLSARTDQKAISRPSFSVGYTFL